MMKVFATKPTVVGVGLVGVGSDLAKLFILIKIDMNYSCF